MKFELIKKVNNARRGKLELSNSTVETPVFMPVGTYGTVKSMTPEDLVEIGTEIILSWLGLGIQPPRPSLGTMLLEAGSISALRAVPWMLIAPGFVAWSLVLCWNLLGDALSDVLNPHTR